jgi:DedD protein
MMERRAKERLIGASILVVLIVLIVPELLSGPKPAAPVAEPPRLPAAASTPEPTRTVTVDLATSKAPAQNDTEADSAPPPPSPLQSSPTAASPAGGTSPAAGSAASAPPTQASATQQPSLTPSQPPASAPAKTAAAAPPVVQSPQHAAAGRGAPASAPVESAAPTPISKAGPGRGWSVQLGSFASRANADNLVRQLKGQGFAVYVLSGGSGAATRHRVRVGPMADRDAAERTAAKLKTLGHASSLMSPGA